MSDLGARLKAAREAAGYSQQQLAKKVGIIQQSIQKMERGFILNPRKLPLIESILGLPVGYLKYGDEEKETILPQPIIARCPILEWKAAIEWPKNKNILLKEKTIKPLGQQIILGSNCYALKIINNAMSAPEYPQSFNEGSYIIIDPDKKNNSGSLVVVAEDFEELLFRRYIKEGKTEYLHAYNRDYDAIKINEHHRVCGVVIAHVDILI